MILQRKEGSMALLELTVSRADGTERVIKRDLDMAVAKEMFCSGESVFIKGITEIINATPSEPMENICKAECFFKVFATETEFLMPLWYWERDGTWYFNGHKPSRSWKPGGALYA